MNIDTSFIVKLSPIFERIIQKKAILDQARPLSAGIAERIRKDLAIEWTYNSNSIEGNSLSMLETKIVLEDGITIGGKSLREHFEVINHEKAINWIEEISEPNYVLQTIDILNIHEIVLKNIDETFAGRIRNGMVRIVGANITPPLPTKVPILLDELVKLINENPYNWNLPLLVSFLHHRFVWIHPFFDGNGRTARLLMNLFLLSKGYPPCIILKNDRKKYFMALNEANLGHYRKLVLLVLQGMERSLNIYLNVLPDQYKDYDSLDNIASEPEVPYSTEYLSLMARRGKINAYKEGRNWVTSVQDVKEYMEKLSYKNN